HLIGCPLCLDEISRRQNSFTGQRLNKNTSKANKASRSFLRNDLLALFALLVGLFMPAAR
ncbi:MAG: hypothetical protein PUC62_04540, partial [Oscillospiraceae bacterium]|nr:hypothetical protein [Oscillospiraceae bacterium]